MRNFFCCACPVKLCYACGVKFLWKDANRSLEHLYAIPYTLFFTVHRIVEKINISIGQDPNSKSIIGVLDIYGFESFKHNR